MGYCATYYGGMRTRSLNEQEKLAVDLRLRFWQDEDVFEDFSFHFVANNMCVIDLSGNSRYYEESVKDFLAELEPYLDFGEIQYNGEDDSFWKFEFRRGEWYEDIGHIEYTPATEPMFKKLEVK